MPVPTRPKKAIEEMYQADMLLKLPVTGLMESYRHGLTTGSGLWEAIRNRYYKALSQGKKTC